MCPSIFCDYHRVESTTPTRGRNGIVNIWICPFKNIYIYIYIYIYILNSNV